MVKNLPASGGDMGSIPGPGRFRMWCGQLSPCTTTAEPMCLEPVLCNKRSHHNEKCAPNLESRSHLLQLEKALTQQ